MWEQHMNINSETSPKKAAGMLSGLKQQQMKLEKNMYAMDGRSFLSSKRKLQGIIAKQEAE